MKKGIRTQARTEKLFKAIYGETESVRREKKERDAHRLRMERWEMHT
jgi:hypothetical protein